ncbi:DUF2507 domain-containing protein [Lacticaseibacillus daqingensis]|uniref:DUF2507 domain-containing protein n=1 Tax=Lacticaseibacillus daqingensis TaxID=2486014 RepID=UPI000F76CB67|nr:DUF2507 domain-containing protein [Lacticaseibacillus daqingensis]
MAKADYQELLALDAQGPLFGELMLRDLLLPDLLGEETSSIAYWAGRALARKLPVEEDQLTTLFERVGFGVLAPASSKHHERNYTLSGPVVQTRIANFDAPDFRLEAGFLAESLQQVLGMVVEANPTIDRRKQVVTLTAALDPKAPVARTTQFIHH